MPLNCIILNGIKLLESPRNKYASYSCSYNDYRLIHIDAVDIPSKDRGDIDINFNNNSDDSITGTKNIDFTYLAFFKYESMPFFPLG